MNKMREYERGREDGLDLTLKIIKQGGIEGLEEEKLKRQKMASLDR